MCFRVRRTEDGVVFGDVEWQDGVAKKSGVVVFVTSGRRRVAEVSEARCVVSLIVRCTCLTS